MSTEVSICSSLCVVCWEMCCLSMNEYRHREEKVCLEMCLKLEQDQITSVIM